MNVNNDIIARLYVWCYDALFQQPTCDQNVQFIWIWLLFRWKLNVWKMKTDVCMSFGIVVVLVYQVVIT